MSPQYFFKNMMNYLEIPFDINDVKELGEDTGIFIVQLKNGEVYSLQFQKCKSSKTK